MKTPAVFLKFTFNQCSVFCVASQRIMCGNGIHFLCVHFMHHQVLYFDHNASSS